MDERITKLVDNKEFVEEVNKCENAETFADVMGKYGIDLGGTDVETAFAQFKVGVSEAQSNENAELSENELAAVSGGAIKGLFYWIGYGLGKLFSKKTDVCI